jgi:metal-responsive CopG/Arc/MetJ family transcriptional regulator
MNKNFSKNTTFSISMPVEHLIDLDKHVEKEKINRSKFIQKSIEFYIKNQHNEKSLENEIKEIKIAIQELKNEIQEENHEQPIKGCSD